MRGDRHRPRGESARVADRVRGLLGADDEDDADSAVAGSALHTGPSWWDRVSARVPLRLDPGHRGALAVGLAVLLAAVITGVWLMSSRPQAVPVSAAVPSVPGSQPLVGTGRPTAPATGALVPLSVTDPASPPVTPTSVTSPPVISTSGGVVVVDVAGKVRRPGVYRLPSGSRVDDAVAAAGGPVGRVDLSSLNLAAVVVDGEQILVGVRGTSGVSGGAATGGGTDVSAAAAIVDLNTAPLEQLETLPGVGPVLGQNILDWRSAHGSFTSIDQLQDVTGIGDVKFAALQPLVSL